MRVCGAEQLELLQRVATHCMNDLYCLWRTPGAWSSVRCTNSDFNGDSCVWILVIRPSLSQTVVGCFTESLVFLLRNEVSICPLLEELTRMLPTLDRLPADSVDHLDDTQIFIQSWIQLTFTATHELTRHPEQDRVSEFSAASALQTFRHAVDEWPSSMQRLCSLPYSPPYLPVETCCGKFQGVAVFCTVVLELALGWLKDVAFRYFSVIFQQRP